MDTPLIVTSDPAGKTTAQTGPTFWNISCTATNFISRIQTWHDSNCIRGLCINFSGDVNDYFFGTKDGDYCDLSLGPDQFVSKVRMATCDYRGGRFDGMRIWLSDEDLNGEGHRFGNDGNSYKEYNYGYPFMILGVHICSGADIDQLILDFSFPIVDYTWESVSYDLSKINPLMQPVSVGDVWLKNGDTRPATMTFSSTYTTTKTNNWSQVNGIKIGITASGSAGVPLLAEGKWSVSTEYSHTWQTGGAESQSIAFTATAQVTVQPGMKTQCSLVSTVGSFSLPYSATVRVGYKNGTSKSNHVSGVFHGGGAVSMTMSVAMQSPLTAEEASALGGSFHQAVTDNSPEHSIKIVDAVMNYNPQSDVHALAMSVAAKVAHKNMLVMLPGPPIARKRPAMHLKAATSPPPATHN